MLQERRSLHTLDSLPVALPHRAPEAFAESGKYRVRLALDDRERRNVYRLRFLVFNLELNEGLDSAYIDEQDHDQFDDVCDHLMVEDMEKSCIVGTYRLQTGEMAQRNLGYYSAQEFEFHPYEALRAQVVELGRACIHKDCRSFEVLNLLWRGIARYAMERGGRYLIGCSSVTTQDTNLGSAMYHRLKEFLVAPELRTVATPEYAFPIQEPPAELPKPPKLLRSYLTVGARIGGTPALDRDFKTIDFLTVMDLEKMAPCAYSRYVR